MRELRFMLFIVAAMLWNTVTAYDFKVDGIYYNIISSVDKTVEVTRNLDDKYLGLEYKIPERVTYRNEVYNVIGIGEKAFSSCKNVESIILPNSVTFIGEEAFNGCVCLMSINIPDSIVNIERYAFGHCEKLKSSIILNSVTSIADYAFSHCTELSNVTMSNSVTDIGDYSFAYCENLKHITIPESVKKIESAAFLGCIELVSIDIPNSVTEMGTSVFSGCKGLKNVDLSDSITSIGRSTFLNCSSLTTIDIPQSVKSIWTSAFSGCTNLIKISLPDSLTKIDKYAFSYCESLRTISIPNSVTEIGRAAFSDCKNLATVNIPESLKSIEPEVFCRSSLVYSDIIIPESVTSIGDYAFWSSSLQNVTIPSSLTSIGDYAFGYCRNLTNIELPKSLISIGERAFEYCQRMTSFSIPQNVTIIGEWAFSCCRSLELVINFSNLEIKKGEEDNGGVAYYANRIITADDRIGDWFFRMINGKPHVSEYLDKDATELVLPRSYRGENYGIMEYAFAGKPELRKISIPDSVINVGCSAFYNCEGLTEVHITNLSAWCNIDFSGPSANPLSFAKHLYLNGKELTDLVIPEDVTNIGIYTFYGWTNLKNLTIGSSVIGIGDYAFGGCIGLANVYITDFPAWCNIAFSGIYSNPLNFAKSLYVNGKEIIELIIPEGITNIRNYAFCGWKNLKNLTIGNSVTDIGDYAFYDCTSLKTATICGSQVNIGRYSFANCYGMTDFDIRNSVKSIENSAFLNCCGITEINLSNSITSIGDSTFFGCTGLTAIIIPNSMTNIEKSVFKGCINLTDINIPNSIKHIKDEAFSDCYKLTKINLPDSLKEISPKTFYGCKNLKNVSIGNFVTCINYSAFENCFNLTNVIIPNSVKEINSAAFSGCERLKSVTIGDSVAYIGPAVFKNCRSLTEFICRPETPPEICSTDLSPFENIKLSSCTLNIPKGCKAAYQNTLFWKEFSPITEVAFKYQVTYVIDGKIYAVDNIACGESITPPIKKGYTFNGVYGNPQTMPAHNVIIKGTFIVNKYKIIYIIDKKEYVTDIEAYGDTIVLQNPPVKEGYTFSGWSAVPKTMPDYDVVVKGSFNVNCYTLTYIVDDDEYKKVEVKYGEKLWNRAFAPIKEGHSFCGWENLPETMPAQNVTVNAIFTVNTYTVTYVLDGVIFVTNQIPYGASIPIPEVPVKAGYDFKGWEDVPNVMPAQDLIFTGNYSANKELKYNLIYVVDGEFYNSVSVSFDDSIVLDAEPLKEGYTFSGWSKVPEKMPLHDVTVTGTFTVNFYTVIYILDGVTFVTDQIPYGASVPVPEVPVKAGYDFKGWGDVPDVMPAQDLIFTGNYRANKELKYNLIYMVDGEFYNSVSVSFDDPIVLDAEPLKEGYTFSGWSKVPETMPLHDVTVTGTFTVNTYRLTYVVDNKIYATEEFVYGDTIIPQIAPNKEGHTFSGWSSIPKTMPAFNIIVTGSFSKNCYRLIYMLDGMVFKTETLVYGAFVVISGAPTKEGYTFIGWSEAPAKMPANDVVVEGSYSLNSYLLTYMVDGEEYATEEVAYGSAITLKEAPVKEGYLFSGWSEVPETMPAKDIVVTGSFEVDGIEAILTDKLVDVYTLQGVMVKRQIPVEDLKRELPTGIYIINGKKVAIRRKG